MSCGPIVATEHKRQKITTDNNQIKITHWSKNEVKCVVLIMKIYDTYIFQNSGINWEIFPHQLVNDIRSLSCGPIVVCLIMKHILKIFSRIQVLIEEKIPINRRFAKCFLDALASLESIKYQIYCTQIKIHVSGCLHSPSWAAVQRQRAANLLQVFVSKNPFQSREPPDLSRPFSLDQGHIEIVLQLMVHVCP